MNPHEKFTPNKMINSKQCTIQRYVYDNKVTHVNEDVITGFFDIMKECFVELAVSCRKKHTFLGMDIELVKDVKINIGVRSHVKEAIVTFEV